jgi:hypothetical protein
VNVRQHRVNARANDRTGPAVERVTVKRRSFALGSIVATPAALAALTQAGQTPLELLARHMRGDWGAVDEEDARANDRALLVGERLLSAYHLRDGTKLWVITEADPRNSTCILLPEDY